MSSVVHVEEGSYLLYGYVIFPHLRFDLGYCQIKLSSMDNLDNVTTCDVSLEYILMSSGLTNIVALFIQHMSPSSWSVSISLLLRPSMSSLSSP